MDLKAELSELVKQIVGKSVAVGGTYFLYNYIPTLLEYIAHPEMNAPVIQAAVLTTAYIVWRDVISPFIMALFVKANVVPAGRAVTSTYLKIV